MTDLGVAFISRSEYSVSIRGRLMPRLGASPKTPLHKSVCLAARGMHDGRVPGNHDLSIQRQA